MNTHDDENGQSPRHEDAPLSGTYAEYRSYLLRMWRSGVTQASVWRASLEDPHTGERVGFAILEQLFAYVMEQTEGGGSGRQVDQGDSRR